MTPLSSTASTDKPAHGAAVSVTRSSGFRLILTIAGKDLRAELRTKETINAALSFALVILVLFSFAFDP